VRPSQFYQAYPDGFHIHIIGAALAAAQVVLAKVMMVLI
jgi:hypothetical protein